MKTLPGWASRTAGATCPEDRLPASLLWKELGKEGWDKEGNLRQEHRREKVKDFTQLQYCLLENCVLKKPDTTLPPAGLGGGGGWKQWGPLFLEQACLDVEEEGEDPGLMARLSPTPATPTPPEPDASAGAGADWVLPRFCLLLTAMLQYHTVISPFD